jgi:hypothetical protein
MFSAVVSSHNTFFRRKMDQFPSREPLPNRGKQIDFAYPAIRLWMGF